MQHVSNVTHFSGTGVPKDYSGITSFAKMDQDSYALYLSAHTDWIEAVHRVDQTLHDQALVRRYFASQKEITTLESPKIGLPQRTIDTVYPNGTPPGPDQPQPYLKLKVGTVHKAPHKPTLSTKPHEAEKRDKKKKLRDARAKAQSEVLQARIDLIAKTSSVDIVNRQLEVKKIRDLKPLRKEEMEAAKSAAQRSKLIKFGSTDITTNIVPDDGWKVTTREKGAPKISNFTAEFDASHKHVRTVQHAVDPSMSNTKSTTQAFRMPTASGSVKPSA